MGLEVKAYLANQLGFSETGRYISDNLINLRIAQIGIKILNPFEECGKEIDSDYLEKLDKYRDVVEYWREFSDKVTPINNRLMDSSDCMLALLDGGHIIDDGVASEIGYYAGIRRGPIFALRSDFRCGENLAVSINPQVMGYITMSRGELIDGQNAIERWFNAVDKWCKGFLELNNSS